MHSSGGGGGGGGGGSKQPNTTQLLFNHFLFAVTCHFLHAQVSGTLEDCDTPHLGLPYRTPHFRTEKV